MVVMSGDFGCTRLIGSLMIDSKSKRTRYQADLRKAEGRGQDKAVHGLLSRYGYFMSPGEA